MTREEQMLNGFAKMMKGFWNNQNLEVPDLDTACKQEVKDMKDDSKELPRWIFHKSGDEDSLVERLMSPGDYYSCPVCFNASNVMYNYCPYCGEKLGKVNYGGENK